MKQGYYDICHTRFLDLVDKFDEEENVNGVICDEDYVPPHKSAAFTPYDCVVVFADIGRAWTEERVEQLLYESEIEYDEIIHVGKNDSCIEGDAMAFISLAEFSE